MSNAAEVEKGQTLSGLFPIVQSLTAQSAGAVSRQKSKALVRIALPKDANIHAREYQVYLPSKQELQRKLIEWAEEGEAGDE